MQDLFCLLKRKVQMSSYVLLFLSFAKCQVPSAMSLKCPPNYKWYKVQNSTLPELCCPENICSSNNRPDYSHASCCDCNGLPEYLIKPVNLNPLYIEYVSAGGKGIIVNLDKSNLYLQRLIHQKGYLTAFPLNICHFTNLVDIDLSYNNIKNIGDIKCLIQLDKLNLSNNNIELITNDTFQGLLSLRELHLKNNKIIHLSPFGIGGDGLTMLSVTMDGNLMSSLDTSNFVLKREFCTLSFQNTPITKFTNDKNIVLETKGMHGPGGYVDLKGIAMKHFPDLASLGVQDVVSLSTLFPFGFDIRDCKLTCDCHIEPFLAIALDVTKKIMRDYFNVTCYNPPELRGQSILELAHQNLDIFVCNMTSQNGCPIGCHCFQQPSQSRTVVDCANKNLSKLPTHMPNVSISSKNLEINLTGNQISILEPYDYFAQTTVLDLTKNSIVHISTEVLNNFRNISFLHLSHNPVTQNLPVDIQILNTCGLNLGTEIKIQCDCDNLWLGDWVRNKKVENCKSSENKSITVMCITKNDETIPAKKVDADFLKCNSYNALYALCLSILIILLVTAFCCWLIKMFKTELYILSRSFFKIKFQEQWKYDIFLKWDESNSFLSRWVRTKFIPNLEARGYTINTPSRDFAIGVVETEEIHNTMPKCRDFIVILSEKLLNDSTNILNEAWMYYVDKRIRKFIIVNFDLLQMKNINTDYLHAFFKLNMVIDFSNHEKDFYKKLKKLLEDPLNVHWKNCDTMLNRNIKFFPYKISQPYSLKDAG